MHFFDFFMNFNTFEGQKWDIQSKISIEKSFVYKKVVKYREYRRILHSLGPRFLILSGIFMESGLPNAKRGGFMSLSFAR